MHSSLLSHTIRNQFFPYFWSRSFSDEMLDRIESHAAQYYPTDQEIDCLQLISASASHADSAGDCAYEMLIECAEAIGRAKWQRALRKLAKLSSMMSDRGDSTERLAFYFSSALACRIAQQFGHDEIIRTRAPSLIAYQRPSHEDIQAAYLALNQVTPFVRFAHLTANQAILEVLEDEDMAHIVDVDIKQGVQWPPLMQALAERSGGPPRLRISGIGSSMEELEQTGARLAEFALSLDLQFEFNPVERRINSFPAAEFLTLEPGEAVAVNCTLQLDCLDMGGDTLSSVVEMIRELQPKVVAVAEKEIVSNYENSFAEGVKEAMGYYSAIFDSLEATLPASSSERSQIERVIFGQEIFHTVAYCEKYQHKERNERFSRWREIMDGAGFSAICPSSFAVAQAKLLLRLHYPAEGYTLFEHGDGLFLGWQDRPLLAVSAWRGFYNF